jgi:hypothetical protein
LLIDGSLLGASAVGLASSYAVGDVYGTRHSLHRRWGSARAFYGTYAVTIVFAAGVAMALKAYLGTVTLTVQALSGALFPSAAVFLVMLANDREVLGPHVNSRLRNGLSVALVGGLILLGCTLDLNTAFPHLSAAVLALSVSGAAAAGLAAWAVFTRTPAPLRARPGRDLEAGPDWTMPPIETLPPPVVSRGRSLGLTALRAYLVVTVICVAIRVAHLM